MESPAQHSSIPYRRDIDGLRAVAVLLVLIYHLDSHNLGGGFVGVDVFFVISGYLISSILVRDIEAGTFTFKKFYERRVRRIAPALLAVLAAVSVTAPFLLFPSELTSFAKSLIAAVASFSNFYFLAHTGYFDETGISHPLLHVWSLAVEEQFYLVFPALLLLLHKFFWRRRRIVVVGAFLLSLGLSSHLIATQRSRTFYMLDTRAWELLTGTLLALSIVPALEKRWQRDTISLLGLAAILGSALIYRASTPFPGPAALLPCIGSALVIWAGTETESMAGRILGTRPLVLIGTISYSLYLIHWPIIVFSSMSRLDRVSPANHVYYRMLRVGIASVSILAAYLSYRFIEKPFRDRRLTRRALFSTSLTGAALLVAFAVCVILTSGFPGRFPPQAVTVSRYLQFDPKPTFREGPCFITPQTGYLEFRPDECLRIDRSRSNYLLMGDSHAAHYWYELNALDSKINLLQATATGCKPFIKDEHSHYADCRELFDFIYKDFIGKEPLDAVILSARWSGDDLAELRATLTYLKGHAVRVILIGPSMEYAQPLPRLIATSIVDGRPDDVFREQADEKLKLDVQMRALATEVGVEFLSPASFFCKTSTCDFTLSSSAPVLFDDDHLTLEGSSAVLQAWLAEGRL